jgi:GNAT superfamily N-acetyltransferase
MSIRHLIVYQWRGDIGRMSDKLNSDFASCAPVIKLRPEEPGDENFLLEVYASTRQEELDTTGWDSATRAAFINMQFAAMRRGYRSTFPHGEFSIVLADGLPIGRIVVNRAREEIRVVDVALLPTHRGKGIGTALMKAVLEEAALAKKPVRLHVLIDSRVVGWYQRLQFSTIGEPNPYQEMEWRPPA